MTDTTIRTGVIGPTTLPNEPSPADNAPGTGLINGQAQTNLSGNLAATGQVIGNQQDLVGLNSVQGTAAQPAGDAEDTASPFSNNKAAVDENAAKPMAGKRLPKEWTSQIDGYAAKDSKSWNAGRQQRRVISLRDSFDKVAEKNPTQADVRSVKLAEALHTAITKDYTGGGNFSAGGKGMRESYMTLAALVSHARNDNTATTKLDVLCAVMFLKPEDRRALIEADLAGSRELTGLMHEAMTEATGNDQQFATALFKEYKAELNYAFVTLTLDWRDPTGTASALFNDVVAYLQEQGVSGETCDAFAAHVAFQMTIHDFPKDLPTAKKGWQQTFTADMISRFAAIPERSDAELKSVLDSLPKHDLLRVIGHAAGEKREGDVHILRCIRDNYTEFRDKMGGDADKEAFDSIVKGLNTHAYDAKVFITELESGSTLSEIKTKLEDTLNESLPDLTNFLNTRIEKNVDAAIERLKHLSKQPDSPGVQAERQKAVDFLREFDAAAIPTRIDKLTAERNGPPPPLMSRVPIIEAELALLTPLRGTMDGADGKFVMDDTKTKALIERFGLEGVQRLQSSTAAADHQSFPRIFRDATDALRQMKFQVEAQDDPAKYKPGLENFSPIMPTYGKDLEQFHHIDSMVQDMVALTDAIRTKDADFSLANNPIIIIDQTDGDGGNDARVAKWNKNDAYLNGLNTKYGESHGLNIVHVSMQDVHRIIAGSPIEKMFDTTGQNNAGYGGARNMAFLLGPVIRDAIMNRADGQTVEDALATITPQNVVQKIKDTAMGQNAPKIFMGDDTDYLGPGAMFAKAGLNALHKDEYYTAVSRRDGRDTTGVSSGLSQSVMKGIEEAGILGLSHVFGNGRWNSKLVRPGMGSVLGSPKFCFDIPTGSEEKHHTGMNAYIDQYGTVRHLSGDRMQAKMSNQMNGYTNYAVSTETFQQFGQPEDMTWNTGHLAQQAAGQPGFQSLGDVFNNAVDPQNARANQKTMLGNVAAWMCGAKKDEGVGLFQKSYVDRAEKYLADNPKLDAETKAEVEAVRDVYRNGMQQAEHVTALVTEFLKEIVPDQFDADSKLKTTDAEVLSDAINQAIDGGADVEQALNNAKAKVLDGPDPNNPIVDLTQGQNQITRNAFLVLQSTAAGGFVNLAQELT
ncbi:MAG: hypothetical protein AAFS07_03670 [Pseudomonadota bacterium]